MTEATGAIVQASGRRKSGRAERPAPSPGSMSRQTDQSKIVEIFSALVEEEQHARNAFSSAQSGGDSPGIRTLKMNLAGVHSEHVRRLRERIYALGGPQANLGGSRGRSDDWPTLQAALASRRADAVVRAAAEAERKVAQAYEKSFAVSELDQDAHTLLRELHREIQQASSDGSVMPLKRPAGRRP